VGVRLRRLVTAASTIVVAIVLAICVPVSQLHTVATQTECCCPDPDQCKCPDHQPDEGGQPVMRACHKTQHQYVAPVLPAFVAPVIAVVDRPEPVALVPAFVLPVPHAAPPLRRPDAPS
jgi:hypothetical protein